MKYNLFRFVVIAPVFGVSLLLGWSLSLIIGFGSEVFIWIPAKIIIIDSLSLGFGILFSLYFTSYLASKSAKSSLILLFSFGIMLGLGILVILIFFLSNPTTFLYAESRTVSFLLINLLFFCAINVTSCGFLLFQYTLVSKEKALNEEIVLKKQMELKFLSAKINPHFLFNSLSLLLSLLKTPEKAEETIINLSELLRYQLDISDVKKVSLQSELDVVEKYLAIQKLRFSEKLSYRIDCQTDGEIPPLIIQPLVENCIKHNIDIVEQLMINVTISKEQSCLVVSVLDSLARLKSDMMGKGIGLRTTKRRVELFGGTFLIVNGGVKISFNYD
ncbi:MAG: hypothetical protein GY786_01990 [Proteobacteria bacterium]|nr:hypothetical protein [Pseudomonadota bacterium]